MTERATKGKTKIYLIGMPGSGKSTLGKEIAAQLKLPFIDSDEVIEQKCAKPINKIFEEDGEDFFRETEAALLRKLSESHEAFVMATGGGAPCFHGGIDYINAMGISLFINVPVPALADRLLNHGLNDRPLLKETSALELGHSLEAKLDKRLPFYKKALLEFHGDALLANTVIAALRKIQG